MAKSCRGMVAGVVVLFIQACADKPAPVARTPDPATSRKLVAGEIIGEATPVGGAYAHAWRAIPYAAAPIGDLRWRAPRPPVSWEGARETLVDARPCPQLTNAINANGAKPGQLFGVEDCLTLDIYAPADALESDAPLPVMVWIHGGGNVWGGSAFYNPSKLVVDERVIVVVPQYRLGPLGWFSHPLLREDASHPDDQSANFGALDQIAALRWVRDNIAVFGGDSARVTLFGESAGAHNIATLLAAPGARGLFRGAIMQSGSFDSTPRVLAEGADGDEGAPPNASHRVARALGASSAATMRSAPVGALFGALTLDAQGYLNLPLVIEDGVVVPENGLRAALSEPGAIADAAVIAGTNRDEMKLFQLIDPRMTRKIGPLIVARDQAFYDASSEYLSRIWRVRAVDEPAALLTHAGHDAIYAYRFDWDEGGSFLFMDLKSLLGAGHGMEIPFVFDRFELFGRLDPIIFKRKTERERQAIADAMGAYWAEFARSGAPGDGGAGLNDWPRWSAQGGTLMRFDSATEGGQTAFASSDSMAAIIADMNADPRLSAADRRRIAEGAAEWSAEVSAALSAGVK